MLGIVGALLIVLMFAATRVMNAGGSAEDPEPAKPAAKPAPKSQPAPAPAPKAEGRRSKSEPKTRTTASSATKAGRAAGLPVDVARALGGGKPVVLFFQQRGADDAAVRDSVRALDKRGGAAVFSDSVRRIDDYELILGKLEISQGPAVVVVDRTRKARVIEGFVDEGTLAQEVRDAKR